MEYTIIRRTKFEGSTVEDMLSIQKTAMISFRRGY